MSRIIVIGGGPAGMMAAIHSAQKHQVLLIEKNEKLGKKLYITGKGRCNITNVCDVPAFMKQIVNNRKFMYSALYSFDPEETIRFFENHGLSTKLERGNRLFPSSDKSSDVIGAFKRALNDAQVEIQLNTNVLQINQENEVFLVETNQGDFEADKVIVATGGVSYHQTGSTGDGYLFAKSFNHTIMPCEGGLVPLDVLEKDIKELQGLSLKNVEVTLFLEKKEVYRDFGEMIFTHFGLSGPVILSASSHMKQYKLDQKSNKHYEISIDLKPALNKEQLDKRILRDFEDFVNKDVVNGLIDLLPKKLIPYVIGRMNLDEHAKIHQITKEQRLELGHLIKNLTFEIKSKHDVNLAVITQGGVDIREIDPYTMESRLVKNLYFVGEVLDVDALTGGYNLQIAYSTGYLAGISV